MTPTFALTWFENLHSAHIWTGRSKIYISWIFHLALKENIHHEPWATFAHKKKPDVSPFWLRLHSFFDFWSAMIWITEFSSTNFLPTIPGVEVYWRAIQFVIAFLSHPKKNWQPPSGEFCRGKAFGALGEALSRNSVFFFRWLFTKCLFVSFFWLNLRNSSVFLGAVWFVWWKMGTGNFKVSWGSPSYGTVLQMLRATCLPPRFPDRNERCWRENQDKGGGKTCGPGDTRNMVSDGGVPSIQPLKGLILVSYEPFRMLRHS